MQNLGRAIETAMGAELAVGPYWGLLLGIYLAEMEGKTTCQISLSTDRVDAKPHRRSIRLAQLGALTRVPDPYDRRRMNLRLTPVAKNGLDRVIDTVQALFFNPSIEPGQDANPMPELQHIGSMESDPDGGTDDEHDGQRAVQGKVYGGGRIALPMEIRQSLNLQVGDKVLFELKGQEVRITPVRSPRRQRQEGARAVAPDQIRGSADPRGGRSSEARGE